MTLNFETAADMQRLFDSERPLGEPHTLGINS